MERSQREILVTKYNEGLADPAEVAQLELLLEQGEVQLTELTNLNALDAHLMEVPPLAPSLELDHKFFSALAEEKKKQARHWFNLPSIFNWNPRWAIALGMLAVGGFFGYTMGGRSESPDVQQLSRQIADLKEIVMLNMLEKESATDRLKAVSLTNEMGNASVKVTDALFMVLNSDPNINVRLATLEALEAYAKDPGVRIRLVQSISLQDSPLVQMALAELMVKLKEKSSIQELKKLLEGSTTPKEVKAKLKESIEVLT